MTARRAYIVTVLCVGPDKSGQVRTGVKYYFRQPWVPRSSNLAHPQTCVQFPNRTSLETLRPSEVVDSGLRHAFIWRKVWTGVKCNFSSPHHHVRKIVGRLSIRRVPLWNFTRIGTKTKKLWLSINPARRLFEQPSLGTPQKGVNCNSSSPEFNKPFSIKKLAISNA